MTNIPFVIKTIFSNEFKWNYVRNKNFLLNCLLTFLSFIILKKDEPHGACSSEIVDRECRRYFNIKNALFHDTLGQSTC